MKKTNVGGAARSAADASKPKLALSAHMHIAHVCEWVFGHVFSSTSQETRKRSKMVASRKRRGRGRPPLPEASSVRNGSADSYSESSGGESDGQRRPLLANQRRGDSLLGRT